MIVKKFLLVGVVLAGLANIAYAGDDVEIVRQGNAAVTLTDVEGFLMRVPEDHRAGFLSDAARVQQMLISILRDKQLASQAVTMKLDQEPEVQAEIAFVRNQILASKRLNAYEATLKIPSMDAAAKEEYLAHKADYVVPEVVDVQHVLISEKDRTEAEAKSLAEKVREEAVANPDGFDQLVAKYSEDPTKGRNNGLVRDAAPGKVVKEFASAAKNLKTVGEISPVVKTEYGYHVLKLVHKAPSRTQDFAAVKDQLITKLKQNYIAEQRKAFLAKLDENAPSVNPSGMEALQQRYKLGGNVNINDAIKSSEPSSK